jgi:hypothetical protein
MSANVTQNSTDPNPAEKSNPEAEQALLGALLIDPGQISEIDLDPSEFYTHRNRWVFQAMLDLHREGLSVDAITLTNRLNNLGKLKDIGGPSEIARWISFTPSSLHAQEYAGIIRECYRTRRVTKIAQDLVRDAINPNGGIQSAIDELQRLMGPTLMEAGNDFYSNWADLEKVIGPICWDWENWLAKGFLNFLVAVTGEGKSILSLRICGCYLLGWPWPDGTPFTGKTGNVVWCEAEAAQALNLDRAKKWRLPVDRILNPLGDPLSDFRLTNADHKGKLAIMAMRPDVMFMVVDSLSGADPTAEKSTEDACNVNWLASLARDCNKPIQLTHHLRKRGLFDTEGIVNLDRVRGSSSILQYSRLIWALDAPDLTNTENKRLAVIKSNLGKKPEPVGLTIDDSGVTFGAAPEIPRTETVLDKAVDLMLALLADEPLKMTVIEDEFKQAGISTASMRRAKDKLKVISIKDSSGWKWGLPVRGQYDT